MPSFTFRTSLSIVAAETDSEYPARITGTYVPGYRGDRTDPPEGPNFDVSKVEVEVPVYTFGRLTGHRWIVFPEQLLSFEQYEALEAEGVEAYAADLEDAQARVADERRDARRAEIILASLS